MADALVGRSGYTRESWEPSARISMGDMRLAGMPGTSSGGWSMQQNVEINNGLVIMDHISW